MPLVHAGGGVVEAPLSEAHGRARRIRPERSRGPLVRVAGARHQAEAEMMQELLLEEGVPSVLRRSAGFDVPDFLAAGPRDVLVPESGAEAARALLLGSDLAAKVPQPLPLPRPSGRRAAVMFAAILGAAAVSSLVAWELVRLFG
jgi:hypothetical protein